jgi:hypothetical protein
MSLKYLPVLPEDANLVNAHKQKTRVVRLYLDKSLLEIDPPNYLGRRRTA